jgi:hypothetical protein
MDGEGCQQVKDDKSKVDAEMVHETQKKKRATGVGAGAGAGARFGGIRKKL